MDFFANLHTHSTHSDGKYTPEELVEIAKADLDYMPFFNAYFGPRRYEFKTPYDFLLVNELIELVHRAGGIILFAHPENQLQFMDLLLDMGLDGLEVYHPDMSADCQKQALRIALEKELFIAGGSDHSGLCGGMYASYEHPEESEFYIEPLSCGTHELHFRELLDRRIDKEGRARLYREK